MKDFLGQEIAIGDLGVVIMSGATSAWFKCAEVSGITSKKIRVKTLGKYPTETTKDPHRFVKCRPEDVTASLLRGEK